MFGLKHSNLKQKTSEAGPTLLLEEADPLIHTKQHQDIFGYLVAFRGLRFLEIQL